MSVSNSSIAENRVDVISKSLQISTVVLESLYRHFTFKSVLL